MRLADRVVMTEILEDRIPSQDDDRPLLVRPRELVPAGWETIVIASARWGGTSLHAAALAGDVAALIGG